MYNLKEENLWIDLDQPSISTAKLKKVYAKNVLVWHRKIKTSN